MFNDYYTRAVHGNRLRFENNNFFLDNIPFLFSPIDLLHRFVSSDDEMFERKLYYHVKDAVKHTLMKKFLLKDDLADLRKVRLLEEYFSASGWGFIRTLELDAKNKRAVALVSNSPIALALHGKVNYHVDHFMRGILAGMFSHIFREDVDCTELKCQALGHRQCEFLIKKNSEHNFSKKFVQRQLNPI